MEAGHLAQNFYHLASKIDSLDLYEYCGFDDPVIVSILKLNTNYVALTSIICGYRSDQKWENDFSYDKLYNLMDRYYFKTQLLTKVTSQKLKFGGVFLGKDVTSCNYNDDYSSRVGFGYGTTKEEAGIKSIVEALERYYCSFYNSNIFDSYTNLRDKYTIIDPLTIVGYDTNYFDQNVNNYLHQYSNTEKYDWVFGEKLMSNDKANNKVLVHSDLIYYPITRFVKNRKPCFNGNSTGVAGHYCRELAIQNSIYELIERDSISLFWLTDYKFHIIANNDLPEILQSKVLFWEKLGRDIIFVNATTDLCPVVICFQFSESTYPYCLAGAACDQDITKAMTKSYNEVEFATISWQKLGETEIKITEIRKPDQHGMYYSTKINSKIIKSKVRSLKTAPMKSIYPLYNQVISTLDPIVFDIKTPIDKWDIWITRVISENLLPLNFGYRLNPQSHTRIQKLGVNVVKSINEPHFFP